MHNVLLKSTVLDLMEMLTFLSVPLNLLEDLVLLPVLSTNAMRHQMTGLAKPLWVKVIKEHLLNGFIKMTHLSKSCTAAMKCCGVQLATNM